MAPSSIVPTPFRHLRLAQVVDNSARFVNLGLPLRILLRARPLHLNTLFASKVAESGFTNELRLNLHPCQPCADLHGDWHSPWELALTRQDPSCSRGIFATGDRLQKKLMGLKTEDVAGKNSMSTDHNLWEPSVALQPRAGLSRTALRHKASQFLVVNKLVRCCADSVRI